MNQTAKQMIADRVVMIFVLLALAKDLRQEYLELN
jgi:hypothetical protein